MIKQYKKIIIVIALLFFIPLLIIATYSRPSADDYSYARFLVDILKSDHNIFQLIFAAIKVDIHAWKTSDGPYISQFFMTLHPGVFGEQYYGIGAIIIIIISLTCSLISFRTICEAFKIDKKYGNLLACVFAATIFTGMPAANEGLYWYDGAVNYTPFYFLVILVGSLCVRMMVENKNNHWKTLIICILAFVASGGNFIVTYYNLLITFTVGIFAFYKKKYSLMAPFFVSLLGFCLEFFAPGTQARTLDGFVHPSIASVLFSSLKGCYVYICEWTSFQWIVYVLLIGIISIEIIDDSMKDYFKYSPIWIATYIGIMIGALLCLPYYANGGTPTGRILNVIWATYMLLSGILTFYFVGWSKYKWEAITLNTKTMNVLAIIAVFFMLCIVGFNNSNAIKASREIVNGTAKEFARLNDIRYEMMQTANQGDELECQPLIWDTILFFEDLDENPEDWKNVAWKQYYGVGMHVVKEQ